MDLMEYDDGGEWERQREKGFFTRRRITSLAWSMFVLQIISNLSMMVAFLSPGWVWTRELGSEIFDGEMISYYGLFWICSKSVSHSFQRQICLFLSDLKDIPTWWLICQLLAGLSLVFGAIVMALITLYIFRLSLNKKIKMSASIIASSLTAALITGSLFILFVIKFRDYSDDCCGTRRHEMLSFYFNYSFYLCGLSCVLHAVCCVLAIVETNRLRH